MKTLIIYASVHHGNTKKVTNVLAETLNADVIEISELDPSDLKNYDLIGLGSGIYYGKFHKDIIKFLDIISELSNKNAFVFSTSGQGKEAYNNSIIKKLENKGFHIVGSFACKGYDTFGPFKLIGGIAKGRPNEEDLKKVRVFAEKIKDFY